GMRTASSERTGATNSPVATTAPGVVGASTTCGSPAGLSDAAGVVEVAVRPATSLRSDGKGAVAESAGVAAGVADAVAASFFGPQPAAASNDSKRARDRAREFIAHPPGGRFS